MTRLVGVRYPLHELEVLLGWPLAVELAEAVGVSVAAVGQWKVRGLSHRQADRLACWFGYHPAELWPEWLDFEQIPSGEARARRPQRVRPIMHGAIGSNAEMADRAYRRRIEMATVDVGGRS